MQLQRSIASNHAALATVRMRLALTAAFSARFVITPLADLDILDRTAPACCLHRASGSLRRCHTISGVVQNNVSRKHLVAEQFGDSVRYLGRPRVVAVDHEGLERHGFGGLGFVDNTNLQVGPSSSVRLDKFVYDPNKGTKSIVIDATKGAFRFSTGAQGTGNVQVKTPHGTLGIRG